MAQTGLKRAGAGGRSYTAVGVRYNPGIQPDTGVVPRTGFVPGKSNTLATKTQFEDADVQSGTRFAGRVNVPTYETNDGVFTVLANTALGLEYYLGLLGAKTHINEVTVAATGANVTTNGRTTIPATGNFLVGLPVKVNPGGANEEPAIIVDYTAGSLVVTGVTINATATDVTVTQPEGDLYSNSAIAAGYEDDLPRLDVERVYRGKWGTLFPDVLVEKADFTFGKGIAEVGFSLFGVDVSDDLVGLIDAPTVGAFAGVSGSGGNVDVGAHDYAVTFVGGAGETTGSAHITVTVATSAKQVNLTGIPTGPNGTTARKLYRSAAGTTSPMKLLTTLSDNTTTAFTDNVADASLSATTMPVSNTTSQLTAYAPSDDDEAIALAPFTSMNAVLAVGSDPEGTGISQVRGVLGVTDAKISIDNGLIKETPLGSETMQAFVGDKGMCTIDFNTYDTAWRRDVLNDFMRPDRGAAFHFGYAKNYGTKASPNRQMITLYIPFGKYQDQGQDDSTGKMGTFALKAKSIVQRGLAQDLCQIFLTTVA
jgi:hypothetical protein